MALTLANLSPVARRRRATLVECRLAHAVISLMQELRCCDHGFGASRRSLVSASICLTCASTALIRYSARSACQLLASSTRWSPPAKLASKKTTRVSTIASPRHFRSSLRPVVSIDISKFMLATGEQCAHRAKPLIGSLTSGPRSYRRVESRSPTLRPATRRGRGHQSQDAHPGPPQHGAGRSPQPTNAVDCPLRVEYELTELDFSLEEPLSAVRDWAERHINELEKARAVYDETPPD
jgi:hypothetical protein